MMPCLVDVNVWLALLAARHVHHKAANRWFEALDAGDAWLCRFVQLAVIRLLGNRTIMGADAVPASDAWNLIGQVLEDERVVFVDEPSGIDSILLAFFRYPVPTGKLVGDAYLAAFAIAASRRIVTTDHRFHQFGGLQVEWIDGA
jgi:toxin-antitoxin system PIN domain toxin